MIFLLRGGWCFLSVILATFIIVRPLQAANWSQTELHLQQGTFQAPYTHQEYDATIITFQHASKWQYGDNYFFIDQISRESENDYYGEFYSNISYSKIFKKTIGLSLVNDIGLTLGLNVAGDANVKKYLPGGI